MNHNTELAIIRQFPEGDIILIFPDQYWDINCKYLASYQFIGQHGACHPDLINDLPAPPEDKAQELIKHYQEHFNCHLDMRE